MRDSANAAIFEFAAAMHRLANRVDWPVLFFAMLASLVGAVVSALVGEIVLAGCSVLSSLFLCVALWARELN